MMNPGLAIAAFFAALISGPASAQHQESDPPEAQEGAAIGMDAGQAFLIGGGGIMSAPDGSLDSAPLVARAPARDAAGGAFGGGFRPFAPPPARRAIAGTPASAAPNAATTAVGAAVIAESDKVAAAINSTGGYRFDGYNDCYGFVRRVWNPVLKALGLEELPVNDYRYPDGSPAWRKVEDWKQLRRGDALATHQGHKWGKGWHGGLFWGVAPNGTPIVKDSHPRNIPTRPGNNGGVAVRLYTNFAYYHVPTHRLLVGGREPATESPNGAPSRW